MSKNNKLVNKLLSKSKDLTWDELVNILSSYGFNEINAGKTSGSARKFINENKTPINIHKPHPKNIIKEYVIKLVINTLKKEHLL